MARRRRSDAGGVVFHVLNRRVGKARLFFKPRDYEAFEAVLAEASERFPGVRVLAYCLMPNHWHLVPWLPRDAPPGLLSRYMQWVTTTHMRRWHAHRGTAGTGPVYQGRFKSFPVQEDAHLRVVCRYIERNPLRAALVSRAEAWRWSSAATRRGGKGAPPAQRAWLLPREQWPVDVRRDWARWVNESQTAAEERAELAALRTSIARGAPFGDDAWARRAAARLGLESSLRPIGRPRKQPPPANGADRPSFPTPRHRKKEA